MFVMRNARFSRKTRVRGESNLAVSAWRYTVPFKHVVIIIIIIIKGLSRARNKVYKV